MKIILFRGRPGSGKTTITHAFAEKTHLPILRKDDFYDPISSFLTEHANRNVLCHQIMYEILESNTHSDATFILDFAFQNDRDLTTIKDWCRGKDVSLKTILVTCSDEKVWAERFNMRADNPMPNQLITNFDELKKYYGTMQIVPDTGEQVLDTVKPVEVLLEEIKY